MSAASAPPPIDTVRHLMVDGHDRRYLLHALPGLQTGRPAPLLLAFHPGYATGAGFARTTGLNNRADALGYAVAYPNGIYRSWNAGDCCGPPSRDGVDDVAFAMSVIDDVASVVSIDRREVFAAGFSNGAGLVYLLACREASSISAIAVAGSPLHIALDECRPADAGPGVPRSRRPGGTLQRWQRDHGERRRATVGALDHPPMVGHQRVRRTGRCDRQPGTGSLCHLGRAFDRCRGNAVHDRGDGTSVARRVAIQREDLRAAVMRHLGE